MKKISALIFLTSMLFFAKDANAQSQTECERTCSGPCYFGKCSDPKRIDVEPNTGSEPPTRELDKTSFELPGDAIKLHNAKLGPFCCTGSGLTVFNSESIPIGYAYFYSWRGQAYNVSSTKSVVPDIIIQVSGAAQTGGDTIPEQVKNEISFQAASISPQSNWVKAGVLEYRAILRDYKLERLRDRPYFDMGSLKVKLDVRYAN